ncbi:MAG: homoserine kinase [Candidatus Melainabacteria bacterium HGW-Melainabacteria-1]|jgi:homoserine kinase|nr:MAG: homoserine kinase [Candidatus Melainabacteria bacterium HGW-Melainabacteria-1]PKN97374.1 MAG: homoserine kinase [Chloroflexi bacterium HGW-Chloroflexi-4]
MRHLIRVPATTANLGPGFDCLGLALDLWNDVEVEAAGDSLTITVEGEGAGKIPLDRSNTIYKTMQLYANRHHKTLPKGIKLHCRNRIPVGSGLGSSSAAIVSGILAASVILEIPQDLTDQLECSANIEGHPDNVGPCLLGGLVAAILSDNKVIARKLEVASLSLMIVVPDYHFPTETARAALPKELPRQDAIFNLGHLALLTYGLGRGDLDLLASAMQDKLHQPYRIPVIPGAIEAIAAAKQNGAAAVALSGAGPSLLIVLHGDGDRDKVGQAVTEAYRVAGLTSHIFSPEITLSGASISVIS